MIINIETTDRNKSSVYDVERIGEYETESEDEDNEMNESDKEEESESYIHNNENENEKNNENESDGWNEVRTCLLYTSPSPRDKRQSRMPSSA